jgi:HEAT repeat protein
MLMKTDVRDKRLSGRLLGGGLSSAPRQIQTYAHDPNLLALIRVNLRIVSLWSGPGAGLCLCIFAVLLFSGSVFAHPVRFQENLTPRQREIEKQRLRLASGNLEERRDGVAQLAAMHHPDASRVALSALKDPEAIVRATAAKAILALPVDESVEALIALLSDREEFVRQEAAYALAKTRSRTAVSPLSEALTDKKDGVRAAAAIALGEIGDESAVVPLVQVISSQPVTGGGKGKRKGKKEQNQFVLRAAAMALGQIRSRAAVKALIDVLGQEDLAGDVKREAARSLGLIGDPASVAALQTALSAGDPYLSQAASEALKRIANSRQVRR